MQAISEDFWFMVDPEGDAADKVHLSLFEHVRAIEESQKSIATATLYNAKLAFNRVLPSLTWGSHAIKKGSHAPVNIRHENLIANGIDTAKALIGKMRPKPTPTPTDADWSIERQAGFLDRILQTEWREQKVYTKMQMAFFDCCWAPIGVLRVGRDGDKVFCERVFPDEIIVDQDECVSEPTPIQMHRRRLMSKVMLKAMYPDFESEIDKAGKDNPYTTYRTAGSEQVVLLESWQVPLPGQKKGRHAVVIETATLEFEDYDKDYFPFVVQRWSQLPTGFYGRPQAEEGAPFQLRHNEINAVIQRSQDLMSRPRIFADRRAKLRVEQLDNDIAKVLKYERHLPSVATWPAVHPELYKQREDNKTAYFEAIGLSRMSAQATLPEGVRLDSSRALGMANFKQNERFQPVSAMLENAFLELAEMWLDLLVDIHEDRKAPEKLEDQTILDEIDWKLLGRPGTRYSLKLQAASLNTLTPAMREEQLNTWAERGVINPDEYKAHLGHPDLEEQESALRSSADDMKAVCAELDRGLDPQPDPLQNLPFGLVFVRQVYIKRKRQKKVSEEILQGYRDWLAEAKAVLDAKEPVNVNAMDPAQQQALAMQSAQDLGAPVGPDGVPLAALAQLQ